MKWSWKIGEVGGISVYLHATFLLLVAWLVITHWVQGHSLAVALAGLGFTVALFASVLLHEFGHAFTAKKYGIQTRDITLLPIGGVARLQRVPEEPKQELWIAFTGPTVNLVIAGVLFACLLLTHGMQPLSRLTVTAGSFIERVMVVNFALAFFNLLPAFPMDGGRVLRALLARRMDFARATQIAAGVGQAMALVFGLIGILNNPFLLFIALFVWIGATQEATVAQMRAVAGGIRVSQVVVTEFQTFSPTDSLSCAADLTLRGSQQDFPVTQNEKVVGVLTRSGLIDGLSCMGSDAPISSAMRQDMPVADYFESLITAFDRIREAECTMAPVLRGGRLVGLLTLDNIGEFFMIRAAAARTDAEPKEIPESETQPDNRKQKGPTTEESLNGISRLIVNPRTWWGRG
jgi:Zn-dependent protease/CBS domain-containing protein